MLYVARIIPTIVKVLKTKQCSKSAFQGTRNVSGLLRGLGVFLCLLHIVVLLDAATSSLAYLLYAQAA